MLIAANNSLLYLNESIYLCDHNITLNNKMKHKLLQLYLSLLSSNQKLEDRSRTTKYNNEIRGRRSQKFFRIIIKEFYIEI